MAAENSKQLKKILADFRKKYGRDVNITELRAILRGQPYENLPS